MAGGRARQAAKQKEELFLKLLPAENSDGQKKS